MPERRYRVLFVASHPVQYQGPLFARLAAHPSLDIQVAYCTMDGAEPAHDADFGTSVHWDVPLLEGYPWVQVKNRGGNKDTFWGLRNPGLWRIIREGKFDAVVSYVGYVRASFWIALLAAKISGAGFIFGTDATSLAPRDGRAWKATVKKYFWPGLFGLADQVIALSTSGVEFMRSLGIPAERITLTPFVVPNDWWIAESAKVDREAVRRSWGVSAQDLVILFCAKLQQWKRPLDLLRAFAKAKVHDAVLVFAGDGPLRTQLETEAAELGVGERVKFLGFVNQTGLPAAYTAADLFVLPSEYDPCPVVVCEAMLCGRAVVISDEIRGRFDLVKPGITGDIYSCGDVQALSGTLRKILEDRGALGKMSANARERMNRWSPTEYVEGTVSAVAAAVAHRTGAGEETATASVAEKNGTTTQQESVGRASKSGHS